MYIYNVQLQYRVSINLCKACAGVTARVTHGSWVTWVKISMGHLGHRSLWVTHSLLCSNYLYLYTVEGWFPLSIQVGSGLSSTHHVSPLSTTSPLHYHLLSATQQGYYKCPVLFLTSIDVLPLLPRLQWVGHRKSLRINSNCQLNHNRNHNIGA